MVYKKYIKRGNKRYGPYLYHSTKKKGKVTTHYLGKHSHKEHKHVKTPGVFSFKGNTTKFWLVVSFLSILIIALTINLVLLFQIVPSGKVFLEANEVYSEGEYLSGDLRLVLKHGELIPANSQIIVDNVGKVTEFSLSDLLIEESVYGSFYIENVSLNDSGKGYGVLGEKQVYPIVYVTFKVIEKPQIVVPIPIPGAGEAPPAEEPLIKEPAPIQPEENVTEPENITEPEENITEEPKPENVTEPTPEEPVEEVEEPVEEPTEEPAEEPQEEIIEEPSEEIAEEVVEEPSEPEPAEEPEPSPEPSPEPEPIEAGDASPITGEVVSEDLILVELTKDNPFVYEVEPEKTIEIVESSQDVDFSQDENLITITTDYFEIEEGFGEQYVSDEFSYFLISISDLGLKAEQGQVTFNFLYQDEKIVPSLSIDVVVEGVNETEINITINETLVNETLVNVTSNVSTLISTSQYGAVLGEPVKWEKKVKVLIEGADSTRDLKIKLPKQAKDILVKKITEIGEEDVEFYLDYEDEEEAVEEEEEIQGVEESNESEETPITGIFDFIIGLFRSGMTGMVVEEPIGDISVEITEEIQNEEEVIIEYFTDAPYSIESDIPNGKQVVIIGPDNVHYENVLAYTTLDESWDIKDKGKIKIYWVEDKKYVPLESIVDVNANGVYDYIEWVVPHLSNQTFQVIIEITKAEHLDSNRTFISDIYDEVKKLDGVWSEEINNNEYVRVAFEIPLDSSRDITIYPRIVNGSPRIEVYEFNGLDIIAEFGSLSSNEYNKVYLTGLEGSQDVFDLRILDGVIEIDHIIDPIWWNSGFAKKAPINISVSSGTTEKNYQVGINITYIGSDMQTDFDDIRFVNGSENIALDYWLETKSDGNWAYFWVEIDQAITTSPYTIYMYYGNSTIESASNGSATFVFFDDFSGASIDTEKWTVENGIWSIENGKLKNTYADKDDWIKCDVNTPANFAIEGTINYSSITWYSLTAFVVRVNDSETQTTHMGYQIDTRPDDRNNEEMVIWEGTLPGWDNIAEKDFTFSANTEYLLSAYVNGSTLREQINRGNDLQVTDSTWNDTNRVWRIRSYPYSGNYILYDDIRVRKYTYPEPTVNAGGEIIICEGYNELWDEDVTGGFGGDDLTCGCENLPADEEHLNNSRTCELTSDGDMSPDGICAHSSATGWACDANETCRWGGVVRQECNECYNYIKDAPCDSGTNPNDQFSPNGICVYTGPSTSVCDPNETCQSGSDYYPSCSDCNDNDWCDSDGGTTFSADGFCIGDICCTADLVDIDQDNESEICGCNSTYNGAQCDSNGGPSFIADGVCVDTLCDTSVAALNCDTDGCTSSDMGNMSWQNCSEEAGGESCTGDPINVSIDYFFTQEGICANFTNECVMSGHVCFDEDEGVYKNDCQYCNTHSDCDSNFTNGDFLKTGLCLNNFDLDPGDICCDENITVNTEEPHGIPDKCGCKSNFSGAQCDPYANVTFTPIGVCIGFECDTDTAVLECGTDGCSLLSDINKSAWDNCSVDGAAGHSCNDGEILFNGTPYVFFYQEGTCTNTTCDTLDHICYNGSEYLASCSSCYDTGTTSYECDSNATSGGDYDQDGICVYNDVCDTSGHACYDGSYLRADCNLCSNGNACDFSITDLNYTADGVCMQPSSNYCCTEFASGLTTDNINSCDTESSVCNGNHNYCDDVSDANWNADLQRCANSGEDSAFGNYTTFGQAGCCNDTVSENFINSSLYNTSSHETYYYIACCNESTDCVNSTGYCIPLYTISAGYYCSDNNEWDPPPIWINMSMNKTEVYQYDTIKFVSWWEDVIHGLTNYTFGINQTGSWESFGPTDFPGEEPIINSFSENIIQITAVPGTVVVWNVTAQDNVSWETTTPIGESWNTTFTVIEGCSPAKGYPWNIYGNLTCNDSTIDVSLLNITNGANLTLKNVELWVGDTIVNQGGSLSIIDCKNTIWQNGNLTINGNYSLTNSTLRMNGTSDGEVGIKVTNSGTMIVTESSNITNGVTQSANYFFIVNNGATFEMKDSYLSYAGWENIIGRRGLEINTTVTEFGNNTLQNNYIGLTLYSDNNVIENNIIKNAQLAKSTSGIGSSVYGIYLTNSNNNTLTNNLISNLSAGDGADGPLEQQGSEGGHSYGIYLQSSNSNSIQNSTIQNLSGGNGGNGGGSGMFPAGNGGTGGKCYGLYAQSSNEILIQNSTIQNLNAGSGGDGGTGSPTGHGGDGGNSYAVYLSNSLSINQNINLIEIYGGTGGNAGDANGVRGNGGNGIGVYITNSEANFYSSNLLNFTKGVQGSIGMAASDGNGIGIYFSNTDNSYFIDSEINQSDNYDVYSESNSNNTLLNTTFSKSKTQIDGGLVYFQWYLDVNVTNSSGDSLENALVEARDKDSNLAFSDTTEPDGFIDPTQNITEYFENSTAPFYYTNYTINTSLSGYRTDLRQLNITKNMQLDIILNEANPPEVYLLEPEDGYITNDNDVTFKCNVSDESSIASVSLYTNTTETWQADQTQNLGGGGENWWNEAWDKRKNIDITNTGSTLSNYPAYINVTNSAYMQADYDDLRFINVACGASGGSLLDYEIENYTSASAHVWVRIPSLSTGTTSICMYYNNSGASNGEDAEGVWDVNHVGVWHISEGGTGTRFDSTSNSNDGSPSGYEGDEAVTGRVGGADDLDATNDYADFGSDSSLEFPTDPFTIEAWIRTTNANSGEIVFYGDTSDQWYGLWVEGSKIYFAVDSGDKTQLGSTFDDIDDGEWHHVVGVRDIAADDIIVYVDGVSDSMSDSSGDISNPTYKNVYMGRAQGGGDGKEYFDGIIDEVRISNITRSQDWINQTYQIINDQGSYVEFGNEETQGGESITTYSATFNLLNINDGFYIWNCYACDIFSSCAFNDTNRSFSVDTTPPFIEFVPPTNDSGVLLSQDWSSVNVSVNDSLDTSAFIDWNKSLRGYWAMDFYNSSGIYDNSTYNNFGSFNGGLGTSDIKQAKYGKGLEFNNETDDYLDLGNDVSIDFDGDDSFTIEVWIKTNQTSRAAIIEKWRGAGGTPYPYVVRINEAGSQNKAFFAVYDASVNPSAVSTTDINDYEWHHVVAIRDVVADELRLYVDGELEDNTEDTTTGDISNMNATYLGSRTGSYRNYKGLMDEVRIYSRALSEEEINASYNNGLYKLYHNFTNLDNGDYEYYAYAIDQAGNWNKTETRNLTIDVNPPEVLLISPEDGNKTSSNVTFICNVSDNSGLTNVSLWGNWSASGWHENQTKEIGEFENDSDTLLLCHFNNDYDCIARGDGNASYSSTSFSEGRFNSGVYIDFEDQLNYSITNNFNNVTGTIEMWIKPAENYTFSTKDHIMFWTGYSGNRFFITHFYAGTDPRNDLHFDIYADGSQQLFIRTNLTQDTWYHVAISWNTTQMNLYLDGDLVNTTSHTTDFFLQSPLCIGHPCEHSNTNWWSVNGTIDELRVSDRMRTAEEIADSYSRTSNVNYLAEFNVTGIDSGTYEWNCYACDTTGNCAYNDTNWTFSANTLPIVNLTFPTNDSYINNRTPTFEWDGYDADNDPLTYQINLTSLHLLGGGCENNRSDSTSNEYITFSAPLKLFDNDCYYKWKVRASDDGGTTWGAWSDEWIINIQALISIKLNESEVNLGVLQPEETNSTEPPPPDPFLLENDGNCFVNVTINATDLWDTTSNPSDNFTFKVDNYTGEQGSFDWGQSITSWTQVPNSTTLVLALVYFNWSNETDLAEIDLFVEVPSNEPVGPRSSQVQFTASLGE